MFNWQHFFPLGKEREWCVLTVIFNFMKYGINILLVCVEQWWLLGHNGNVHEMLPGCPRM